MRMLTTFRLEIWDTIEFKAEWERGVYYKEPEFSRKSFYLRGFKLTFLWFDITVWWKS